MKCEIIKSEKQPNLPNVGQPWAHYKDGDVYIRISDDDGMRWFRDDKHISPETHFFSWNIEHEMICITSKNADRIILLEQVEPAKFKVKE